MIGDGDEYAMMVMNILMLAIMARIGVCNYIRTTIPSRPAGQGLVVHKLSGIVLLNSSDALPEADKPAIQELAKKIDNLTKSISLQTIYRLADYQGLDT